MFIFQALNEVFSKIKCCKRQTVEIVGAVEKYQESKGN